MTTPPTGCSPFTCSRLSAPPRSPGEQDDRRHAESGQIPSPRGRVQAAAVWVPDGDTVEALAAATPPRGMPGHGQPDCEDAPAPHRHEYPQSQRRAPGAVVRGGFGPGALRSGRHQVGVNHKPPKARRVDGAQARLNAATSPPAEASTGAAHSRLRQAVA